MNRNTSTAGAITRGVARWGVRLAVWSLAAAVVLAITVVIVLPRATQGFAMTVLTGSMTPEIPVGSVVLVRPVDPSNLGVGDIATYRPDQNKQAFITHRVIGIEDKGPTREFVFKGDANDDRDFEPVPAEDVVGAVWFHVPFLGSIRDALHGKAGLSLLAMVVLGGYTLTQLGGAFGDSRGQRRHRTSTHGVVEIHRPLVLAELPRRTGELPIDVARGWGALLIAEGDTTFTLLIAPPDGGLSSAVQVLRDQSAVSVQLWEPPTRVAAESTAVTPVSTNDDNIDDDVPTHAW